LAILFSYKPLLSGDQAMRIVFAGPGAIGSLFAARISLLLTQSNSNSAASGNHSIWLLDYNQKRAQQLNRDGLILQEKDKQIHCAVNITNEPQHIGNCDALFLCVKSHAVSTVITHADSLLTSNTLLVSMQNGIGHLKTILNTRAIPAAAITSEGAALQKTGHVIHGGFGSTQLGLFNRTDHPAAENSLDTLTMLLNKAGIHTIKSNDPLRHIWTKLFANIGINALTALNDLPNGKLLDSAPIRELMKKAVTEAVSVAHKLEIPVEGDPVLNTFAICKKTSHNISSMLQDVRHRRLTEIDAINGAIVEAGIKLNIPTPVNCKLVAGIKELERSYLSQKE
jgi:2-dehydropantoate 2-reductase